MNPMENEQIPKRKYRKLTIQEQISLRDRYWNRLRTGETVQQIADDYNVCARNLKKRVDAMGKE